MDSRAFDSDRPPSARRTAQRALDVAGGAAADAKAVREDLAEIKEVLGHAPSPGRPGAGLVGAVSAMQLQLDRIAQQLDQRDRDVKPCNVPPRRLAARAPVILALVAALGGGAGITAIITAVRGNGALQVQTTGGQP
jgi:hypothetical protein